jgi:hypothetical protein
MSRKLFLTIASAVAALVGGLSLLAPDILLGPVKAAVANPAALVMARTVGVLLLAVALLAFLVRGHGDSPWAPSCPTPSCTSFWPAALPTTGCSCASAWQRCRASRPQRWSAAQSWAFLPTERPARALRVHTF